jgi:hypothetical protein
MDVTRRSVPGIRVDLPSLRIISKTGDVSVIRDDRKLVISLALLRILPMSEVRFFDIRGCRLQTLTKEET